MVDRRDPRPPYVQVADDLRASIASGQLEAGDKLLSLRQLQEQFDVSTATVQQALNVLKDEGLIEGVSGSGVFVRKQRPMLGVSASYVAPTEDGGWTSWGAEAAKLGMKGTQRIGEVGPTEAPDEIAEALRLENRTIVIKRERTMFLDDEPVQTVVSYYPASIAQGTPLAAPTKIPTGAPALLAQLGFPPIDCTEVLTARMPTPSEANQLALPRGVPVIRIIRTTMSHDHQPVEACVLTLAAHRHRLIYQLPIHST